MNEFHKVKREIAWSGYADFIQVGYPNLEGWLKNGDMIEVKWDDEKITEHKVSVVSYEVGCEYQETDEVACIEIKHNGTVLSIRLRDTNILVRRK
jgi:hypothetical protein